MTPPTSRARRLTAAAVGITLGLTLGAAPAQAAGETGEAVSWLNSQRQDGLLQNESSFGTFPDYGLSIDAGIAAYAVGRPAVGDSLLDAVRPAYEAYIRFDDGSTTTTYGNSTAKLTRFLQIAGSSTTVDGEDLVATLERLVEDGTGRLTDQVLGDTSDQDVEGQVFDPDTQGTEPGSYTNTFGQAFAVGVLGNDAAAAEDGAALSWLLQQQCPGGGFRLDFSATDATCTDDAAADVDTTAVVIQQLQPLGTSDAEVAAAADWLVSQQDAADGAFTAFGEPSSNSTGLAADALALAGRPVAAGRAADFTRGFQVRAPGVCRDADEGAVAASQADVNAQKVGGITPGAEGDLGRFVRATAQATLGLQHVTAPSRLLRASATRAYVRARTIEPVLVSGLAARDTVCVSNRSVGFDEVGGLDGTATVRVSTGLGTRNRVYTVEDTYGRTKSVTLRVLGARTFTVKAPRRRVRGDTMRVVASGLASGERATLKVRRGDIRVQYANRRGIVVFDGVDVVRKPGKRRYVVRGKFGGIRKGSDVVRILRAG